MERSKKTINLNRRLGKIKMANAMLEGAEYRLVVEYVFRQVEVLSQSYYPTYTSFYCRSELFDELPLGAPLPYYTLNVHRQQGICYVTSIAKHT